MWSPIPLTSVFARNGDTVRFHPCPPLDAADVDEVLATVTAYVGRLLAHGGSGDGDDGGIALRGKLFCDDGDRLVEGTESGHEPIAVGRLLAERLMNELGASP